MADWDTKLRAVANAAINVRKSSRAKNAEDFGKGHGAWVPADAMDPLITALAGIDPVPEEKFSKNELEDAAETGPVTAAEAQEILSRFVASAFKDRGREHARFSIPANPSRDDDVRLSAYITQSAARIEQLQADGLAADVETERLCAEVEAEVEAARADRGAMRAVVEAARYCDEHEHDSAGKALLGKHLDALDAAMPTEAKGGCVATGSWPETRSTDAAMLKEAADEWCAGCRNAYMGAVCPDCDPRVPCEFCGRSHQSPAVGVRCGACGKRRVTDKEAADE